MNRLAIGITDQQHQSLKTMAALQGETIKFPSGVVNDQAWHELKSLLQDRIEAGLAGNASAKSIDEILKEELATGDSV